MFSTDADPRLSKTFCIGFNCQNTENLATIRLNGDPLPWKQVVNHVGTKLHSSGSMETDMREKRARFIQSAVELNQEFESLEPESQLRMLRLYNMHFSGSNCFDFQNKVFQQLVNSYNVNIRIIFDIPRNSHCWLTEQISGRHAKQQIYSRYIKFVNTLQSTERQCVKSLFEYVRGDVRSLVGGNLRQIFLDSGVLVEPGATRPSALSQYCVYQVPEGEEFRLPLLVSLLQIRSDNWSVIFNKESGGDYRDDDDEIEDNDIVMMINEVCSS